MSFLQGPRRSLHDRLKFEERCTVDFPYKRCWILLWVFHSAMDLLEMFRGPTIVFSSSFQGFLEFLTAKCKAQNPMISGGNSFVTYPQWCQLLSLMIESEMRLLSQKPHLTVPGIHKIKFSVTKMHSKRWDLYVGIQSLSSEQSAFLIDGTWALRAFQLANKYLINIQNSDFDAVSPRFMRCFSKMELFENEWYTL